MGQSDGLANLEAEAGKLPLGELQGVSRRSSTGVADESRVVSIGSFPGSPWCHGLHPVHGGDPSETVDEGDVDVDQAVEHPISPDDVVRVDEEHRGTGWECPSSTHATGPAGIRRRQFDGVPGVSDLEADHRKPGIGPPQFSKFAGIWEGQILFGDPVRDGRCRPLLGGGVGCWRLGCRGRCDHEPCSHGHAAVPGGWSCLRDQDRVPAGFLDLAVPLRWDPSG